MQLNAQIMLIKSISGSVILSICLIGIILTFFYRRTNRTFRFLRRFPLLHPPIQGGPDRRTVMVKNVRPARSQQQQQQQQQSVTRGAAESSGLRAENTPRGVSKRGGSGSSSLPGTYFLRRRNVRHAGIWRAIQWELERNYKIYEDSTWSQTGGGYRCGLVPEMSREAIETGGWGSSTGMEDLNRHISEMESEGQAIEEGLKSLRQERDSLIEALNSNENRRYRRRGHTRIENSDIRGHLEMIVQVISQLEDQLKEQKRTLCHFKDFVAKGHVLLERMILCYDREPDLIRPGSSLASISSSGGIANMSKVDMSFMMGRSQTQTIRSFVEHILDHYCSSRREHDAWNQFLEMYERARFSNEEISRSEYVHFMKILSEVLRYAERYAEYSIRLSVEGSSYTRDGIESGSV